MIDDGIPGDAPKSARVSAWLSEIERAFDSEGMAQYDKRCGVIRKRYRYEGSAFIKTRQYQLLWSNIETMKSAVYARPPKAVVARRYRDADPVGRATGEILERAINFSFESSDFDGVFKQVRDDFLLYGRGCARIYYEPEYETENDLNEDIEDAADISQGPGLATGASDYGLSSAEGDSGYSGLPRGSLAGNPSREGVETGTSNRAATGRSIDAGRPDKSESDSEQNTLKFENVRIRFVQRADFRHQAARTWEEVQWVAFRAFLTRAEVAKRFGEDVGKGIGLDSNPADIDDNERTGPGGNAGAKATIWEIWDKTKNKVLWIAKNWPDVLEEGDPYLVLDGFYPCPRPAYGTLTPDSLVPVPDYIFYQDQCEEIDQLTARIGALSDALKLVGFYPAGPQGDGAPEMEKAFSVGFENKMIAVQNWDTFRQGGGSGPPVVFLPIDQVINILEGCVKLRQQLVEDVYQIVGISDIMRGATDPQETEGAQQLKAQYGGTRIRDRQQEIARFCRDVGRLTGQVIASYCSPVTIQKMTNMTLPTQQDVMLAQLQAQRQVMQAQQLAMLQGQVGAPPNGGMQPNQPFMQAQANTPGMTLSPRPPVISLGPASPPQPTQEQVFGLLRDALTRRFKIDIENDSTIAGDESQERQDRTQFIESVTRFVEAWGPMTIQKPELAPLAGQLLLFGVRSFRVGRELEDVIEETANKLATQQMAPQGPDAKVQAEQIKLQGTQAKTQAEIHKSQIDSQTEQQAGALKAQSMQMELQTKIAELQMKLAALQQQHQHKIAEAGMAHGAAMDKMALNVQKQHADAQAQAMKPPTWPVNEAGF